MTMKNLFFVMICVTLCVSNVHAEKYNYKFNNVSLSDALTAIAEQNNDIQINFIYNELDSYYTSAIINTDDTYDALRRVIGLNPVSIINKGHRYYIEALQHGKFDFYGRVINDDNEPIVGASVIALSPRDSTVITYGISDIEGRFSLPCDKKNLLIKFSCVGYRTKYVNHPAFSMGSIKMQQLPVLLSNVSVESDNTVLSNEKNTYIPSSRQKNASIDATDLLRRMAIPQLVINPGDNSVKDVFGNIVPVYINYHRAENDELVGLKTTDVRKIEFIEFPTDPRFNCEQRVVNIIVQEYEYGGYTKISEAAETLNGVYNNTTIFNKFTFKKMTYDLFVGNNNKDYRHYGAESYQDYHLDSDGDNYTVHRDELLKDSHRRTNEFPVTLRASYITPKFTARNTLSYTYFSNPDEQSSGELKVNLHPENDYSYIRTTPNKNNTIYYRSNLWGRIGSAASFDITPSFLHTHRNNISAYESTLMQAPISNFITENTYNWGVQANARMILKEKHQLSLFISGGQNINKLNYRGTDNIDDSYYNSYVVSNLRYMLQNRKYSVTSFFGFGFSHNSMNGLVTDNLFPWCGVNGSVSINKKSNISAYLYYQITTPDIDMKANDKIRSNEFLYLTGNPYLKDWTQLTGNISCNWFHNNALSLAVFAGYTQDFNRVATVYRPYADGAAIIRDYMNDGDYINAYAGLQINYKLFNNSLQLYANLTQNAYRITGSYKNSFNPFRVQLQAVYYWKSFNILASWGNPRNTLTENSNIFIRGRNFHVISVGWGNGKWNVNIGVRNLFNKGWNSEIRERSTPLFREYQQFYNPSAHRSLNLTVAYTVGYGKKVQRGNEVGAQSGAPSAIIK